MRKKYKNMQNRGESQKGLSFAVPERRSQIITDNNGNNLNKNSFISNFERKSLDEKILNKEREKDNIKDKDLEKPRITINKDILNEKKFDNNDKNINPLKSSNHNILISVYKKDSSNDKNIIPTTKLNKNIYTTRNENKNIEINDKNIKNNTLIKNNHRNSKRIFTNQNSVQNISNILEKNENLNLNKSQDKKLIEKNENNDDNKDKYKRKKSYNNIHNKTEIDMENNNNNMQKSKKIALKINTNKLKTFNDNIHNNYSTNNLTSLNKVENITNFTNNFTNNFNFNSNTERNTEDKFQLYNFRKIRIKNNKDNQDNNDYKDNNINKTNNIHNINNIYNINKTNDDISKKTLGSSFIFSPNSSDATKVKRRMAYRSKRSLNDNTQNEELNEIDDNINNNNDNMYKDFKKRKYIIKVTKTPDESNNIKDFDNETKIEIANEKKKKIRHFLYYKANKDKEKEDLLEREKEKEINSKKEENLLSPNNIKNSSIRKTEIYNSPTVNFKKINNQIYKITPKQPYKEIDNKKRQFFNFDNSLTNIFQSCKNDINTKNYEMSTLNNQELNQSFTYFPNGLELNNKNISEFNYIYNSNVNNINNANGLLDNSNNKINNSKFEIYKNNSIRNKKKNSKTNSPTNIIYRKKMNLIKSICNYYKKNIGILTPNMLFNSNNNSHIEKYNNNMNHIAVTDKRKKKLYDSRENNILNNIINNNTFNTTLNIYKMNKNTSKEIKSQNDRIVKTNKRLKNNEEFLEHEENEIDIRNKKHLRRNSELPDMNSSIYFSIFNENNINSNNSNKNNNNKTNKIINSPSDLSEIINNTKIKDNKNNEFSNINNNNYKIDLKILYILEVKLQNILNKINSYMTCTNECFDYITYYFSSKFYEKEINIFKSKRNNNISYYIKLELLCYFLCYDVGFSKSFSQAGILLKTIFNLLHNNYLILISFILNEGISNEKNDDTEELLDKLKSIIRNNLNVSLSPQDYNETNILSLIDKNLKEVNTFYKMIVDNIYSQFITKKNTKKNYNDIKYKFPQCLQLDINALDYYEKLNIISLFFFDAYRLINNYNFEDLKYFFDSFLQRIKFGVQKKPEKKSSRSKVFDSKKVNMKSVVIYKYNYNNGKFYYLPPIKKCYKYTLVLDLDETLVYLMQNNIYVKEEGKVGDGKHTLIFRPGLIDFLKKMRPLFELVIFSFGTYEYVNNVIKIIEKKGKFFEHVLYRQHATDRNGEYVKDLSLLGRDLKNIIIVDDIPQVFKMQEKNGICIKPFYGDIITDKNTLNILGKILEKIRFDADEDGDIRKSLDKQRNLIFSHITNID